MFRPHGTFTAVWAKQYKTNFTLCLIGSLVVKDHGRRANVTPITEGGLRSPDYEYKRRKSDERCACIYTETIFLIYSIGCHAVADPFSFP